MYRVTDRGCYESFIEAEMPTLCAYSASRESKLTSSQSHKYVSQDCELHRARASLMEPLDLHS